MAADSLTIRRLAGALGAEIGGVDLSEPLDDQTIAVIRQALVEHQVVFFRDQSLTPEAQVRFGARFGPLNIHPYVAGMAGQPEVMEIIKEPQDKVNFGGGWHSDMSFLPRARHRLDPLRRRVAGLGRRHPVLQPGRGLRRPVAGPEGHSGRPDRRPLRRPGIFRQGPLGPEAPVDVGGRGRGGRG